LVTESSTPSYPIQLHITGWPVLVVGGGEVAERKVRRLLECGAQVTVVADAATPGLRRWAAKDAVAWCQRKFATADVAGARLVFAATDDRGANQAVAEAAAQAGVPVNVADDPDAGTFHLPARIRRGSLQISIATEGGAPFLARRLRRHWEQRVGPEWEAWLAAAARFRAQVRARVHDSAARQRLYDRFFAATFGSGEGSPHSGDPQVWTDWIAAERGAKKTPPRDDGERA
jgi:precorrin-2 dehydrogenase/sirohydrochlorin ferrochelatase